MCTCVSLKQPTILFQVHSVAWNCTGRKLASGSVDQSARIWLVENTSSSVRSHTAGIAFKPDLRHHPKFKIR
jgi:WD40 repeat protein